MAFRIPLQVHVIWHPKDDSHCRPIAEYLRTALTRDSYQPMVPGIGIPMFYRCAGAIPGRVNGAELEDDPGWHRYLADSIAETNAKSPHAATIRVALSSAVAGGADLVIDPKSPQAVDQVLQLAILQACRLLSGRPRDSESSTAGWTSTPCTT